jgi:2-dehydro-3-deoxy-D-arabinonate dehydratase
MPVQTGELPTRPCLVRLAFAGRHELALWSDGRLGAVGMGLDDLLRLTAADIRSALAEAGRELDPAACELLAPAESQEVWASGVTYMRSRTARMEESSSQDVYAKVYEADRPEMFFKAAGWRVVGHGGEAGVRPDSSWNVPEPELAVLSNSRGEVVAYACGNDMSSRSIEGENPLYLPQAKVYDRSCSIGPAAVLAWTVDPSQARVTMRISRGPGVVFDGTASVADMVRDPAQLSAVLHSAYPLPAGAWLLTGTSLVPPPPYTAEAGDVIAIEIDGVGRLVNHVVVVSHSGATALPRQRHHAASSGE